MKIQNIEDLRLLVEAARTGSLTAAAQVLKVTPATASSMLKRLDGQLGARLFERSTRSIRLTSQGQNLLGYASRALALIDEGEAQVLSESSTLSGMVRVAVLHRVLASPLGRRSHWLRRTPKTAQWR